MAADKINLSSCEFWLVRHAESEWNLSGRWQGHADPALSATGRLQAQSLAKRLAGGELAGGLGPLYCSDLKRTLETANSVGLALDLTPQTDSRLRELDIGRWSGLNRAAIEQRDGDLLRRFDSEDADVRPPGGETRREIRERARSVMSELAERHPSSRILVVTHLGLLRALLPGVEPANAELIRIAAVEALNRRSANSRESNRSAGPF